MFTAWDWTEIGEGIVVSLMFILAPLIWRMNKHHNQVMKSHDKLHKRLSKLEE